MKHNRYRDTLEKIVPEASFERDTIRKLEARKKHTLRRWIAVGTATAVCALTLCFSIPMLRKNDSVQLTEEDLTIYGVEEVDLTDGLPYALGMLSSGPIVFNTAEFDAIVESGFKNVKTSPLSTFAADVDTASYTTLRRLLLDGTLPDADAIRVEEMLNYFDYDGLAPEDGSPIAIHTALCGCPWSKDHAILFVGVGAQAIEAEALPNSNLVFLVDVSGSMDSPDKLDLIKQAFALLCGELRSEDTISIVTYAGYDSVLLEGVRGSEKGEILDAVESMTAYGCTNGGAGILTAYDIAKKYFIEGGNNRVILLTDGDLNVGTTSEAALTELITEKRDTGVFLSVFGFGSDNLKDNKLEALADNGNGNYCYIDSLIEAKRSLIAQIGAGFVTVAKDVKLQVEFNPAIVSSYRLIGYENRELAAEDFADDTKDGGEMGSGHTVVALYELIPAEGATIGGVTGTGETANDIELRYQASEATGSDELATVAVRYKAPDGDTSTAIESAVLPDAQSDEAMRRNADLACAVAEFGMLMRNSEYMGDSTYENALALVKGLADANSDEIELAYLITRAQQLSNE